MYIFVSESAGVFSAWDCLCTYAGLPVVNEQIRCPQGTLFVTSAGTDKSYDRLHFCGIL